jgi:hypothetical protein
MFTKYAQIENGQVIAYPLDPHVKNEHGELNVPEYWTGGDIDGKSYVYCHNTEPFYNYTQDIVEITPVMNSENGLWYRQYQIVPASEEVVTQRTQIKAEQVNGTAKSLQAVADKALSKLLTEEQKTNWENYKLQISSLIASAESPWEIVWPPLPDEVNPIIEVTRL